MISCRDFLWVSVTISHRWIWKISLLSYHLKISGLRLLTGVSFNCWHHLCESFKCTVCLLVSFWCISLRLQLSLPPAPTIHKHYDFLISSVKHTLKIKSQKETVTHGRKNPDVFLEVWTKSWVPAWWQTGSQDQLWPLVAASICTGPSKLPFGRWSFHSQFGTFLLNEGSKKGTAWPSPEEDDQTLGIGVPGVWLQKSHQGFPKPSQDSESTSPGEFWVLMPGLNTSVQPKFNPRPQTASATTYSLRKNHFKVWSYPLLHL